MTDAREYDFYERLDASHKDEHQLLKDVLLLCFPKTIKNAVPSSLHDNKNGIDWIITFKSGETANLDLKMRDQDYGKNDVALEVWSVKEENKIGWTRDHTKQTDYILWIWRDTKRYVLIPFVPLRNVFKALWEEWYAEYKTALQRTDDYHSECIFVPIIVVWNAMQQFFDSSFSDSLKNGTIVWKNFAIKSDEDYSEWMQRAGKDEKL